MGSLVRPFAALAAVLPVAMGLAAPGCGQPEAAPCRLVRGELHAEVDRTDCGSPIRTCTRGVLAGPAPLAGTTALVGQAIAPAPGLPEGERPQIFSYTGLLTLAAEEGTLSFQETGVFDLAYEGGLFTARDAVVGGTGRFEGAAGHLFFNGRGVTQFTAEFTGEICLSEDTWAP